MMYDAFIDIEISTHILGSGAVILNFVFFVIRETSHESCEQQNLLSKKNWAGLRLTNDFRQNRTIHTPKSSKQ